MTAEEYAKAKQKIEHRFTEDSAALDRTWVLMNGTNPPDSPLVLREPDMDERAVAEIVGRPTAVPVAVTTEGRHEGKRKQRQSFKGLSAEQVKEKKAEYMREYHRRRMAKK